MVILHFWVQYVVFEKDSFISQNNRSLREPKVIGTVNILWHVKPDQIIVLDFTGIGNLKYKEIRVSGAKFVWWVLLYNVAFRVCRMLD